MRLLIAGIGLACLLPVLTQQECFTWKLRGYPGYPTVNTNQEGTGPTRLYKNPFLPSNTRPVTPKITPVPTERTPSTNPFFKIDPPSVNAGLTVPQTATTGSCSGPDLLNGVCTPLRNCQPLLTRLQQNPTDATFSDFLRQSNAICRNEYAVVCCPSSTQNQLQDSISGIPTRLPTIAEGCGIGLKKAGDVELQVVGGKPSSIRAWPWIALIGYDDTTVASPFKCGGSLVTSRHVLTAAHCIRSDLTFVRLGEHDLSTDSEAKHLDVPVTRSLRHPQYKRTDGRNDVALLYLAQNVPFSESISPICLPITAELRARPINASPIVAGWGKTLEGGETATVLQELQVPVLNNSFCKDLYKKQNNLVSEEQFDDSVICAGVLEGGKDTCQGDSGGPLMLSELFDEDLRTHQIGIVSYGVGCARPETPGVYSRVANFIDWIQQRVAETT